MKTSEYPAYSACKKVTQSADQQPPQHLAVKTPKSVRHICKAGGNANILAGCTCVRIGKAGQYMPLLRCLPPLISLLGSLWKLMMPVRQKQSVKYEVSVMCSRQDLAEEGNSMGVRMGSLAQVNTALTSAQAWAKSAAAASAPSTSKAPYSRRPPIAQASLPSTMLQPPLLHFARANLFGSRLDQGQLMSGKFVVSQVEKLLVAYEEMAVELPEAADLKARNQQALAWVEEAHKHLSAEETPTEEHAPILEVSCLTFLPL